MSEITREYVEDLKADWESDPIWDLEDTEGLEAYRDELKAFADAKKAEWEARRLEAERKRLAAVEKRAGELGCSVGVMQYILALEDRVNRLEKQTGALLEYSNEARRELASY